LANDLFVQIRALEVPLLSMHLTNLHVRRLRICDPCISVQIRVKRFRPCSQLKYDV
jgi:hypothetical protein